MKFGGHKAQVIDIYPPNDYRDYALIVAEALERGLVPTTTCFRVDKEGTHSRVPIGWGDEKVA